MRRLLVLLLAAGSIALVGCAAGDQKAEDEAIPEGVGKMEVGGDAPTIETAPPPPGDDPLEGEK